METQGSSPVPDRIDKQVLLRAPRERVWRAVSDSAEFGRWFRVRFDGPFVVGAAVRARVIDPPRYAHLTFVVEVEALEPMNLFSYRWHPAALDPAVDYSSEPTTKVTFTLEDAPGGTLLRVSETGFQALPPARRAHVFDLNESGWEEQMRRVESHVSQAN